MLRSITESDWKVFRRLHPVAMDRFCEQVLRDISAVTSRDASSHHERYSEIYKIVRAQQMTLVKLFDDLRRSTALMQLRMICSHGLLTSEEIAQFSAEAQDEIKLFLNR